MLISSILFVLREALEAALLIGVLFFMVNQKGAGLGWLVSTFTLGWLGAFGHSAHLDQLSESFDFRGQELLNIFLYGLIVVLVSTSVRLWYRDSHRTQVSLLLTSGIAILLAISLEGSEVLTYLLGVMQAESGSKAIWMGSFIGLGIGVCVGVLIYQGLKTIAVGYSRLVAVIALALFSGNLLSQIVLQSHQAGWLHGDFSMWDSSRFLSESSVIGQLLYALVGYEATPTLYQFIAYWLGVGLIVWAVFGREVKRK